MTDNESIPEDDESIPDVPSLGDALFAATELPRGLIAAGGWCAPPEDIYDIFRKLTPLETAQNKIEILEAKLAKVERQNTKLRNQIIKLLTKGSKR